MARGREVSERSRQGGGRFEQWRAGWRVALRMARRDVRRHRGRSLLIAIMVGLPVLLLVAGSTLWYSEDLDTAERLPLQLGQSQGYLTGPDKGQFQQLLDPSSRSGGPDENARPARPMPGLKPGGEAAALGNLVGGRVVPVTSASATVSLDRRRISLSVLGVDATAPGAAALLAPRVTLDSGRWPTSADEIVVTPTGIAAGLPTSGTIELRTQSFTDAGVEERARTVSIVGTGQGFQTWSASQVQPVEVITTPAMDATVVWLVDRRSPITWPEIERLNTYGVGVYSRYVAQHPETVAMPTETSLGAESSASALYAVGAATLGLLLLTTLLAGPAFAVSAARQRRTLALAASNGATRAQLRRSVLAQALVLGVLSSVAGAATGGVLGVAGASLIGRLRPDHFFGPIQVPWSALALVTAAGVVSSVVAALIPSRGLGRLDIVSIMRGQSVSPRLRRGVPVVGLVLAGLGIGAVLLASFRFDRDIYFFVFLGGVLLLVIGALLIVPLALALGGRAASRMPLPLRMAAREAGRLRGRATPTVAAIMGGATVLATVCIGLQADTLRQAASYEPMLARGQALLLSSGGPAGDAELIAAIRRAEPSIHALAVDQLSGDSQKDARALIAVPSGCTLAETIATNDGNTVQPDPTPSPEESAPRCAALSTAGSIPGTALQAADLDELTAVLGLTLPQRAALADGAIARLDPDAARGLPVQTRWTSGPVAVDQRRPVDVDETQGKVTLVRYVVEPSTAGKPGAVDDLGGKERVTLPVVHLDHAQWVRAIVAWNGGPGGLITTQTARNLHLAMSPYSLILRGDGPITLEQEQRINEAVGGVSADATVQVERGFQRSDGLIIALVIAVISLVILVATLIATALGQAEAAPLLGTLAAVGATRRTRRAMAGAQAAYLALLGAVLGVLVGIPPGVAISRIITTTYAGHGLDTSSVIIDIPWPQILLPVLLIPFVAGGLAWLSVRRAPVVTRRPT